MTSALLTRFSHWSRLRVLELEEKQADLRKVFSASTASWKIVTFSIADRCIAASKNSLG
jgi:hypothetical protein